MMKIILPVRIKTVLKDWVKRNVFNILINELRKIAILTHLIKIKDNYNKKLRKMSFEKIKEYSIMIKCKDYFSREIKKNKIKNILKKYLMYKWNKSLVQFAKFVVSNKLMMKKE